MVRLGYGRVNMLFTGCSQALDQSLITGIWSLSPLLSVKIVHLVDRSDLFKISNLVYDGKEIVRSLYSSLEGQRVLWRV